MESFDLNFVKDDICYNSSKRNNPILSGKKIQAVSFYLERDIGRELLDIINMDSDTISKREDKILRLNFLKHEILKELVDIRLKYNRLYSNIKNGKTLTEEELEDLNVFRVLKRDFFSSINFCDEVLHIENSALKKSIRSKNRHNNVDLKSSYFLDDDSFSLYDKMVHGRNFYEANNHIYLSALSYYLKTIAVTTVTSDILNKCNFYVNQVIERLSESREDYLQSKEDINLLKQVLRQRLLSISKDDKVSKDFFNKIQKRVADMEARNAIYEYISLEEDDLQLCEAFYTAVNQVQNIDLVKSFLSARPDLIYMSSPSNQSQYYLADIIFEYGNLLLNARENHEKFEYYGSLINLYNDVIFSVGNQDIKLFSLKMFQKIMKNVSKSNFDTRRIDACLFELSECINRLSGEKNNNSLKFNNTATYHHTTNDIAFSIDDSSTKLFEQAYSYREDKDGKYLTFYIPDTTEVYSNIDISLLEDLVARNSEKNKILSRKACDRLNLKEMANCSVIGYHFVIGDDYQVKDLDIRKEFIRISSNFSFSEVDELVNLDNTDNYYVDTIRKMYETLSKVDSHDCVVGCEKFGKYLTTKLSLFFQTALGKYCDDNDIPYISRFVYTKKQADLGLIKDIDEVLNSNNLTVEQIKNSVENAYLAGIYAVSKTSGVSEERRAKVTAPFRQLPSYINQMVIYHYFVNGNNISYREDLRNRRTLNKITDALNKNVIQDEMEEVKRKEENLKMKIKQVNKKVGFRIRKANEN